MNSQYLNKVRQAVLSATPEDFSNGVGWYLNAHRIAKNWSKEFSLPVSKIAGIISALSPQLSWEQNLVGAKRLISDLCNGEKDVLANLSPYMQTASNVSKAQNIFLSESSDIEDIRKFFEYTETGNISKGYKTLSFFLNIADPDYKGLFTPTKTFSTFGEPVTIDRHIINFLSNGGKGSTVLTSLEYFRLWNIFQTVGKENNLKACQIQAIVWNYHRTALNYETYKITTENVPF